mgnify:CR=1 FL=1
MERRYRESESNTIREELARYLNTQACDSCSGSRLRTQARNVFIGEQPIHHVTAMPIEKSFAFFESPSLPGQQGEIATRIVRAVSYTLRTLPTIYSVWISVGALSLNNKQISKETH